MDHHNTKHNQLNKFITFWGFCQSQPSKFYYIFTTAMIIIRTICMCESWSEDKVFSLEVWYNNNKKAAGNSSERKRTFTFNKKWQKVGLWSHGSGSYLYYKFTIIWLKLSVDGFYSSWVFVQNYKSALFKTSLCMFPGHSYPHATTSSLRWRDVTALTSHHRLDAQDATISGKKKHAMHTLISHHLSWFTVKRPGCVK